VRPIEQFLAAQSCADAERAFLGEGRLKMLGGTRGMEEPPHAAAPCVGHVSKTYGAALKTARIRLCRNDDATARVQMSL
jgi:hypothetical protein